MYRSLLPRYAPCIRFSSPVHVPIAHRSGGAVRRKPLNPRSTPSLDDSSSSKKSSGKGKKPPFPRRGSFFRSPPQAEPRGNHLTWTGISTAEIEDVSQHLAQNVRDWTGLHTVRKRLLEFGILEADLKPALSAFADYWQKNDVLKQLYYSEEQVRVIKEDFADPESHVSVDVQLTRLFFEWAANPIGCAVLEPIVDHRTIIRIQNLVQATDMFQPAKQNEIVRTAPRRKIIMHVGPTNSGKTHNALRALAAAPSGVYCGPLRMLAFEIWERLNKGQIVPLGHDQEAAAAVDDVDTITDAVAPGEKPAVQKYGDPKFARPCNLVTGDDQRIVAEDAPLVSCTVEMLGTNPYDVAVIDEIQLISDTARGGSWTSAVLGVNAREVHLCGEESAVPLVRRLLEDVGDEFEVKRYERLTPLNVAERSLGGHLARIQPGDCVIAFSRGEIYKLRDKIEQTTGLRCALAYGKLPPEVRSQQAELFNDPKSGYDVLVGSDAVGMGLNLKIKRMIFSCTWKWDGRQEQPLSARHLKQIAGRAGRFGLHDDSSGGIVASLLPRDMDSIHAALAAPTQMLRKARYRPPKSQLYQAAAALPAKTPLSMILWLFHYVGKHHPMYALESPKVEEDTIQHIDAICGSMPIQLRMTLKAMPFRWKDALMVEHGYTLLRSLRNDLQVRIDDLATKTGITKLLEDVKVVLAQENDRKTLQEYLHKLEVSHAVLIAYIWLGYRLPICFPDHTAAGALRDQNQAALEEFLAKLSASNLRHSEPYDFKSMLPVSMPKIKRPKTSLRTDRKNSKREAL